MFFPSLLRSRKENSFLFYIYHFNLFNLIPLWILTREWREEREQEEEKEREENEEDNEDHNEDHSEDEEEPRRRRKEEQGTEDDEEKEEQDSSESDSEGDREDSDPVGDLWFEATHNGNVATVLSVMRDHPDFDVNREFSDFDWKGLRYATEGGHVEIVKALLAHPNINVNLKD